MAFVKKTWTDRISQYPNRRTINDGNVTKVVTVGRDEGTITQSGDAFNASNMNDLEDRIENGINSATPDLSNYYTKSETDTLLGAKADASDTYTKTEVDTALALKANSADVYTKAETDALLNLKANYPTDTLTNQPIATFPDGSDNVPLSELEVEIEPNLSGVSSVNVVVNAKNFNSDNLINGQIGNNGGYTSSTNRITNAINESPYLSHTFLKKGTYTLSISGLDYCTLLTKDKNNNILDNFAGSWNSLPFTFTLTQDGYVLFTARLSSNADISPSSYNAQIEQGSTSTTYEPYNGTTYPISLGETLTQGGSLNVKTGLLTRTDTTTSQLSGMPDIRTILGNNNIFADSGDIEKVTYFKTGCESIARLIEAYK